MLDSPQKGFKFRKVQIIHKFEWSKYLSPLGKYSASLGMCKVTSGVEWLPVSHMCVHVNDLWRGMVSRKSLTCVWIKKTGCLGNQQK